MSCKMIFPLQSCIANITNKTSFDCMRYDMLFNQWSIRISHLTFRTAKKHWTIQSLCLSNFSWFRSRFLFFRYLLFFCFLRRSNWRYSIDIRNGSMFIIWNSKWFLKNKNVHRNILLTLENCMYIECKMIF